jgi:uncharacterized membrane protein YebE (DUF533 family)
MWGIVDRTVSTARQGLGQVSKKAQEAGKQAAAATESAASAASGIKHKVTGPSFGKPFNLLTASDEIRVAFYGALFAMAAIDGSIDKDELKAIFEVVDFDGLSPESQRVVRGYLLSAPSLAETLAPFAKQRRRCASASWSTSSRWPGPTTSSRRSNARP